MNPALVQGRSLIRSLVLALLATLVAGMAFASAPASAAVEVYRNSTPVDLSPGTGERSTIDVSGQSGRVTGVTVTLHGFTHSKPDNMAMVLIAPDGTKSMVMADACGPDPISNRTWVVNQSAPNRLVAPCDQVLNQPTSLSGVGVPADFDRFVGSGPDGQWGLYVNSGSSGKVNGGWSLTLETAVPDAEVPNNSTSGVANPYPLTRTVSGMDGVIEDVDVSLAGVSHQRPEDLDLMLVGPRGQKVMLMSDACGDAPVANRNWSWNQQAPSRMSTCPTNTGFLPSDYADGTADPLPDPAPAKSTAESLSAFNNTDANGEWRLYAYDDQPGATGFFVDRFRLHIETRPKAKVTFVQSSVQVAESTKRAVTLRRSGSEELGEATVKVVSMPGSASGSDYTPVDRYVGFAAGEREKQIVLDAKADRLAERAETYTVLLDGWSGDATPGTQAQVKATIPGGATCYGKRATMVGTSTGDVLRGTSGADVIASLGGHDTIRGTHGNDVVCAGRANDTVYGEAGHDRLFGGLGQDRLVGGTGFDRCWGGTGRDRLSCERKVG